MIEIVAADKKWGIGIKGDLLTPLPEDMKFFRETTKNSVVIYGRKTSLSAYFSASLTASSTE